MNFKMIKIVVIILVSLIGISRPLLSETNQTETTYENRNTKNIFKKASKEITKEYKSIKADTGEVDMRGETRIQSQTKRERLLGIGVNSNAVDMREFMHPSPQAAIDKATEPFVEGIKSDPKKSVRVKGDPELADLANKHTTHIKDAPGDKELRELVRKTKKTMDV